jgi:hypothetical protein
MSTALKEYANFGRQLFDGSRVQSERNIDQQRRSDIQPYLDPSHALCVLDLANGQLRSQYTVLKAAGHQVVGIDLVNRACSILDRGSYHCAR